MKIQRKLLVSTLLLVSGLLATAQNTSFTYQGRVSSGGTAFNGAGQFKFALVTSLNANQPATATANLSGQFVVSYTVTSAGSGYVTAPAVTISGGGGSGATAQAVISGGVVTSIVPNSAGAGYTSPPTVTIAPPPVNIFFTTFWSNDGTSVNGSEPTAPVSVPVSEGLFTIGLGDPTLANMAPIDASVFLQPKLQLRIWFNNGVNGFAALHPPQALTPAPYAAIAGGLAGPLSSANLSGAYSGAVNFNNSSNSFSGAFTGNIAGNGGALTNLSVNSLVVVATNVSISSWGLSQFGQRNIPAGLGDVLEAGAGIAHSLALKPDGTVVAWGGGQTNDPNSSFDRGQAIVPEGLAGVRAIAASYLHNLALKTDGTVVAWGWNDFGQTNVPAGLNNVTAISGGAYHSLALKTDGTVVAWGTNSDGQLNIPAGLNNVKEAAAGLLHNLALRSNGTVVVWGNNNNGQTNIPAGLNNVAAISAGGFHNLALKLDGTVVAWGAGLTNDPNTGLDFGQSIVPGGLSNVVAVVAGYFHSTALKNDGTVIVWGDHTYGQTKVPPGLNNVMALARGSGALHALALRKRAFAPVAMLDSDNTFNGSLEVNGDLRLSGDMRLDDGDLWLRGGDDRSNGLGWYGAGKSHGGFAPPAPDGPVLFGRGGGGLGISSNNQHKVVLSWHASQRVGIGTATPGARLSLGDENAANKLLVYENAGATAGFGFTNSQFLFHKPSGGRYAFFDAPSGGNEVLSVFSGTGFLGGMVGIGTVSPSAKLHVNGNIRMGPNGYYASGGTENLRIIRGVVSAAGNALEGTDFTSARTSTGVYTITFSPTFLFAPAMTANAQTTAPRVVSTPNVTTSGAGIRIFFMDLNPADVQFSFIAIGPR